MEEETCILHIFRGEPGNQYWEEFVIVRKPFLNIIAALMEIRKNPITREGKRVNPVAWEAGCLEEVCGSCSMLINGIPRQACTALVETLIRETHSETITLAPLSKFPLIKDLVVDRTLMFENLKKAAAWIEADDSRVAVPERISQKKQQAMYALSTCMTCGCCQEACPQVNAESPFFGPQIIGQVELFNVHPTARFQKSARLHIMMGTQGIGGCSNVQNCVRVCPKKIPLTDAIAAVGRDVTIQAIRDLFSLPEREE